MKRCDHTDTNKENHIETRNDDETKVVMYTDDHLKQGVQSNRYDSLEQEQNYCFGSINRIDYDGQGQSDRELEWILKQYQVNNDNINDTRIQWIRKKYQVDNDTKTPDKYDPTDLFPVSAFVNTIILEGVLNQYRVNHDGETAYDESIIVVDNDNDDILNAKLQFEYENWIENLDGIQREDLEWVMKRYTVNNDNDLEWYMKQYQVNNYITNLE